MLSPFVWFSLDRHLGMGAEVREIPYCYNNRLQEVDSFSTHTCTAPIVQKWPINKAGADTCLGFDFFYSFPETSHTIGGF